ncbi:MAG: hypothetical protein AAGF11_48685 [Myxococcota bacterium]
MKLEFVPIEVIFRGLGEHDDPKTQIAGELTECDNAVFVKRGRVSKRRGYRLIPVVQDVEGNAIDPYNLMVGAVTIHRELLLFGYDTLYSLVAHVNDLGSGRLVQRGPTFRGNVAVRQVSTAPMAD